MLRPFTEPEQFDSFEFCWHAPASDTYYYIQDNYEAVFDEDNPPDGYIACDWQITRMSANGPRELSSGIYYGYTSVRPCVIDTFGFNPTNLPVGILPYDPEELELV